MVRMGTFVAALAFLALSGQLAQAHMAGTPDFQVTHPWAEASANGATRAFPTISNDGDAPVAIVGAASPIAKTVKMVAKEREVERLTVPAGETLGPEEMHFHIVGLSKVLHIGGHFPLKLRLDSGKEIEFHVVVGEDTIMPEMPMKGMKH